MLPTYPTAIITGAGSGIGRATALRLSALGYRIALVGRREAPLRAVAEEITTLGGQSLIAPADVSQPDQVEALIQKVHHHFHQIDVLINNAGSAPSIPLTEMPIPAFHETLNTNLSSAFYTTRAVWPIMQSQPTGGTIINISSMAARDPFPGLGAYAIAKAALNMLTLVTAREGHPFNIRAHGIAPGAVDTLMFRNLVGQQNVHPEKILHPTDIASTIAAILTTPLPHTSGETIYLHHGPA